MTVRYISRAAFGVGEFGYGHHSGLRYYSGRDGKRTGRRLGRDGMGRCNLGTDIDGGPLSWPGREGRVVAKERKER